MGPTVFQPSDLEQGSKLFAKDVIDFVIRELHALGKEFCHVHLDSSLLQDLHLNGDEAHWILSRFCDEFQIEEYTEFHFSQYFDNELEMPISFVSPPKILHDHKHYRPFRIRNLVDSVSAKKLLVIG